MNYNSKITQNENRLNEIVEMVQELSTADIANVFFEKDAKGRFLCPWPEHRDRNGSSFLLNKNHTFKCFSCGNRPVFSIHDYIKEIYGIKDIKQSCLFIAYRCNLISEDEYIKLKTFQETNHTKMVAKYQTKEEREFVEKQPLDVDTLDKIYQIFIMGKSLTLSRKGELEVKPELKLSEAHYNYLKNERNLSDEDIKKYGYFTYPKYSFMKPFLAKMNEMGYDKDTILRVPGFFLNKEKNSINFKSFRNKEYIGIPIYNCDGKIRGIQLRADKVDEKQSRYIWLSSNNLDETKFESGLSPNSPIDVVYPDNLDTNMIAVTEGHFKAVRIAKTLGMIALSVQGVGNWRHILEAVKQVKAKYPKVDTVTIMYDADMAYKIPVLQSTIATGINLLGFNPTNPYYLNFMKGFKVSDNNDGTMNFGKTNNSQYNTITSNKFVEAGNNLILGLRSFKSEFKVKVCVWDYNYGKGIDDFMDNTNNFIDGLISYDFSDFIYKMSCMIEELLCKDKVTEADMFESFQYYLLEPYLDFHIEIVNKKKNEAVDNKDKKEKEGNAIVHF